MKRKTFHEAACSITFMFAPAGSAPDYIKAWQQMTVEVIAAQVAHAVAAACPNYCGEGDIPTRITSPDGYIFFEHKEFHQFCYAEDILASLAEPDAELVLGLLKDKS